MGCWKEDGFWGCGLLKRGRVLSVRSTTLVDKPLRRMADGVFQRGLNSTRLDPTQGPANVDVIATVRLRARIGCKWRWCAYEDTR